MTPFRELKTHELIGAIASKKLSELESIPRFELTYIDEPETLPPNSKPSAYYRFRQLQIVPKKLAEIFPFFCDAKNLEKITPKLLQFKILEQSTPEIEQDTEFIYQLKVHGIPIKWKTHITEWDPPHKFVDYQVTGPYRVWYHTHMFVELGDHTALIDDVKFVLPLGILGRIFGGKFITSDVKKIFKHRFDYLKNMPENR